MCGLIGSQDSNITTEMLMDALTSMSYRGIEDLKMETSFPDTNIGHVSLPLCSLDPDAAEQPKELFAFVGEIFNWKDFSDIARNDVEMIRSEALCNHLETFLSRLHKMDGFWAIVMSYQGQLVAITDYLSQKPIYYRTDMNAVASEPKALLGFGETTEDKTFFSNVQKWGYDPTGRTAWNEIKQMPPGSVYIDGTIIEYWNWDNVDACTSIRQGLSLAIRRRIDVARPLSMLLSGGLDSSIIYEVIKQNHPQLEIEVFHVENGESHYANRITTDRTNITIDDVTDREAVEIHQSPVDLGSVKPQIALGKAIADQGYHVVMTGDGADELFGGYRRAKEYDSQYSDVFCELPYYHLPRLDRTMMHSTIEVRSPFLAPYIVKYALELDREYRIDKLVLKLGYCKEIPAEILHRKKEPLKSQQVRKDLLENTQNNIELFKEIFQ